MYLLNLGSWRSVDGGRTFSRIRVPHGDCHVLWIDPRDSRRVFFQAEDGIRDVAVTGVQTCALPIYLNLSAATAHFRIDGRQDHLDFPNQVGLYFRPRVDAGWPSRAVDGDAIALHIDVPRSEERRVGKECRSRWSPYH